MGADGASQPHDSFGAAGPDVPEGLKMAKNEKRVKITLECQVCKNRNYITTKNKMNDRERLEMKKYCKYDRVHTAHKETR